jgi:hypothetical protein
MRKTSLQLALSLLTFLALPSLSAAQDALPLSLPDPSTIEVPDIAPSADAKVARQGHKFFYFNNPDVTFDQAYIDLSECRRFLEKGALLMVPGFVPWDESDNQKITLQHSDLSGAPINFIGAILMDHMARGQRANTMRMCMEPRGYKRYAIKESSWETLNRDDAAQTLLMQAKIGSAAKPSSGEVLD